MKDNAPCHNATEMLEFLKERLWLAIQVVLGHCFTIPEQIQWLYASSYYEQIHFQFGENI